MGAVATTFVAGVEAIRQGIAPPIGSLTQMGTVRLGKRTDGRTPAIRDFVPLAQLFGGRDGTVGARLGCSYRRGRFGSQQIAQFHYDLFGPIRLGMD